MYKATQYILIFVVLFIFTTMAIGDAFDQTVNQIKILEVDLEENQADIEEKQTFIEEELKVFRANHTLNAPQGEFESDEDYAGRLRQLDEAVAQRRAELQETDLSPLRADRLEIQTEISRLHRRIFLTNDVTVTLGLYNANEEYFPITFVANNESVDVRLYIDRQNDAPNLKNNWNKVVKTAYISIDPGYRRGLAQVKLEYPPLWEEGVKWDLELYHLGDNHRAVAFSPDGKYIATGDDQGHVSIWNFSNSKKLRQTEHSGAVYGVAFSPDGQYLATADSSYAALWKMNNGKLVWRKYVLGSGILGSYRVAHYGVAFSPDGRYLADANDKSILVHEVSGGRDFWGKNRLRRGILGSYTADFTEVSFSPDGNYLATGDTFKDAIIWNAKTGETIWYIQHSDIVWDVDFRPDGQYLATGDNAGNVSICEVSSGQIIQAFPHDGGWVGDVAFSPDGTYLAVGHENQRITFYRMEPGEISIDSEVVKEKSITTIGPVYELAWHPFGNFISDGNKVYRTLLPPDSEIPDITPSTPTASDATVSLSATPVQSPTIGELLTFPLNITESKKVAGYQATVEFDTTALRYVSSENGDYLPQGAFFVPPIVDGNKLTLAATSLSGESNGDGTLAELTFELVALKSSTLKLSKVSLVDSDGTRSYPNIEENTQIEIIAAPHASEDVNEDGVVNILDLVAVASNFGQTGENTTDVNEDGVVDIVDLVLVAGALGSGAAAPSAWNFSSEVIPTRTDVQNWLFQAQQLNLTDATSHRGIRFLEYLLAVLTPKETALLPNYPNPFNPETWIPYQLAQPTDVTLRIYAVDGTVVRTLKLGHQPVGIYQDKSRAAYWDGKNEVGETVASGVYLYTLTTGDFTATRKMLIWK